jgi:hypothetical protein
MNNVSEPLVCPIFRVLEDPEDGTDKWSRNVVIHHKTTPGKNPDDFKPRDDHGGSLQSQVVLPYIHEVLQLWSERLAIPFEGLYGLSQSLQGKCWGQCRPNLPTSFHIHCAPIIDSFGY